MFIINNRWNHFGSPQLFRMKASVMDPLYVLGLCVLLLTVISLGSLMYIGILRDRIYELKSLEGKIYYPKDLPDGKYLQQPISPGWRCFFKDNKYFFVVDHQGHYPLNLKKKGAVIESGI